MKKKVVNKPQKARVQKARVTKEKAREVISELDDLFGFDDQIEIDAIIDQKADEISIKIPETTQSIKNEESGLKRKKTLFTDDFIKTADQIYTQIQISDSKDNFYLKFKHFLMRDNLELSSLTYRKISKFVKYYDYFDMTTVKRELNA